MSNPTEQLLMTLGSHWALLNIVVVSLTILFMCKKKPAAAAGTTAPSAPAGDKKPEEIKEDKKEENLKEKEEKKSEKKEGSKKSKKEEKKEEKKEDEGGEKKEEGGDEKKEKGGEEKKETSKKEAGSKKASGSKKGTSKKKDGSKLVDIDEHASDLKEKTDNPSPTNGEKKDEKKEEHKLLIDQKELKFTNPEGKEEILKLNLNNTTGLRIGIKIKCSDNTLFRVDPVFSFLEKDANCVVEISRNAGNPKQDKLSVVYVEAPPDLNDAQAVFKLVQTVAANKIKTISVDLNAEAAAK